MTCRQYQELFARRYRDTKYQGVSATVLVPKPVVSVALGASKKQKMVLRLS